MSGPLSDAELTELYEKYAFLLVRRLRFVLRNEALAHDVLHDGFIKLMQTGAAIREVKTPLRWLYRVFDNLAIDRLRSQRARGHHAPFDDVSEDEIGPAPGIDVGDREAAMMLLGELGETDARIAIMVFVDGITQEDAAQEVGLSRVTVNKRIQALKERGRAVLRESHAPRA